MSYSTGRLHVSGPSRRGTRSTAIQPQRAAAVTRALDRVDRLRTGKEAGAAAALDQLDAVATQVLADSGAAQGRDAMRLRSLGETLKGRAARLR
jgi:hypothetical protein